MEDKHRKHIIDNLEKLIRHTRYDDLINYCRREGILSSTMCLNIEKLPPGDRSPDDDKYERHKRLFIKLTKRGPEAYAKLINIFDVLRFEMAFQLLNSINNNADRNFISLHTAKTTLNNNQQQQNHQLHEQIQNLRVNNNEIDGTQFSQRYPHNDNQEIALCETKIEIPEENQFLVKKSEGIHRGGSRTLYKMQSRDRGVLFCVNIIDFLDPGRRRNGAEKDSIKLLHLYKELGFKLFFYENLKSNEFLKLLDELIHSNYTLNTECFTMILMTHGNSRQKIEYVEFAEGGVLKVDDILRRFNNLKCPNLRDKPKIFIFPFCRDSDSDLYIAETDGNLNRERVHVLSDVLVCYATTQGNAAHRDNDGSWYIQKYCQVMAEHAHEWDFIYIIQQTQKAAGTIRDQNNAMQAGSHVNHYFNNTLYLNPGAFIDT